MTAPVHVNGTSLAYAERGTGDAVVLVHGSASDQRTWHGQPRCARQSPPRDRVQPPPPLVQGQRSPRLFHRLLDALEARLPTATRVTIAQAPHLMHEDNPPAYNAAVLQHLRARHGR